MDRSSAQGAARKGWLPATIAGYGVPGDGISRNNALSVFAMGALPAVAGSAVSILLGMFFVWGILSLLLRRFPLRLSRSDRIVATTLTVFAAIILLTSLAAPEPPHDPFALLWLLPFLSLWVIIPRLRAGDRFDLVTLFAAGAAAGAAAAGLMALAMPVTRVSGGAGNAAVFAIMCLLLTAFGGLNLVTPDRLLRRLAVIGLIGGLVAMSLSLTRWVLLAVVPVAFLLAIHAQPSWGKLLRHPLAWVAAAAVALLIFWNLDPLQMRMEALIAEMRTIAAEGPTGGSVSQRVVMWGAALAAIADSPIWGHGVQNRMSALYAHLPDFNVAIGSFSHAHNGILTFALDGGILAVAALVAMLAMPVVVACRAPRDGHYRKRLFLALLLSLIYAFVGLTHIMFKHDIMDAFFIFSVAVIAASIPPGPDEDLVPRPG